MSLLKTSLGLGPSPLDTTSSGAPPPTWFTSQEMYDLERRAVFSKKWLLTTHSSRLATSGDWVRYDVAGFQFILVQDRQGVFRGFHNVCRHRAFPIVTDEKGHNSIFACKYHGWSYGLNGKLAKAPGYQDVEGFDKAQNGLLPVHVHVDGQGFLWVNMDGGETPEIAWKDDFEGVDEQTRVKGHDLGDYVFDSTWDVEGAVNWKILADNYHQASSKTLAELNSNKMETKHAYAQEAEGVSTYYFPNASTSISSHLMYIQRFVPSSPTKSAVKYEVYRNKNSSDADFSAALAAHKKLAGEASSSKTQPDGPLFFQAALRDSVVSHHRRETDADGEIWPARQTLPKSASTSKNDENFCSNVDCCRINKGAIAV